MTAVRCDVVRRGTLELPFLGKLPPEGGELPADARLFGSDLPLLCRLFVDGPQRLCQVELLFRQQLLGLQQQGHDVGGF